MRVAPLVIELSACVMSFFEQIHPRCRKQSLSATKRTDKTVSCLFVADSALHHRHRFDVHVQRNDGTKWLQSSVRQFESQEINRELRIFADSVNTKPRNSWCGKMLVPETMLRCVTHSASQKSQWKDARDLGRRPSTATCVFVLRIFIYKVIKCSEIQYVEHEQSYCSTTLDLAT